MPQKTYIPGIRLAAKTLHKYGTRYADQLEAGFTTEQVTCFVAMLAAVLDFINCIGERPKES